METSTPKPSGTDNAIKAIGVVFGAAHFIFQSAADLTAEAEGRLVHKVSKGAITKASAIEHRKNSTALKQQSVLDKIQQLKAKHQPNPQTNESQV